MTAQEIIDLRKKLGMSQVIFAERLGVSFATVNRWENGRHIPSPLAVEKIKSLGSSMPVSGAASAKYGSPNKNGDDYESVFSHMYNKSIVSKESLIKSVELDTYENYQQQLKNLNKPKQQS